MKILLKLHNMSVRNLAYFNLFAAVLLVLNIFIFHSIIIGSVSGLLFLFLTSFLLGEALFKNEIKPLKLFLGFLTLLSVTAFVLSVIYYFYKINNIVVSTYILLLSLLILFYRRNRISLTDKTPISAIIPKTIYYFLIYLIFLSTAFLFLKSGRTLEPVRTPWHFVSGWFFIFYFFASAWLFFLIIRIRSGFILLPISLHLLFSFSIASIILPLGFGYDPFIHQATEKYILEHGLILPKPFYYLGQYALVVFSTKILSLPHIIIDKNLVPFLSALLLPPAIYFAFFKNLGTKISILLSLMFFLMPFSSFTFTTPQNLAELFVVLTALLGFSALIGQFSKKILIVLIPLSLAALSIHPIAGIAAFIFIIPFFLNKIKISKKFILFFLLLSCFLYLLAFAAFSFFSPLYDVRIANNLDLSAFYHNLFRSEANLFLGSNLAEIFLAAAYLLYHPMALFLIILILAGAGYSLAAKQNKQIYLLPTAFLILLVNSFLLFSFVSFDFLIDYERGDFSWRIFNLGVLFLTPLALFFIGRLINSLLLRKPFFKFLSFAAVSLLLTFSLYFSYPRNDAFYYTRGFNTSVHDFRAVKYLDEITKEDYVVLSNQQAGAAALTTFGFRYYDNKYFFYSIPTGGELYKIFTKMAYEEDIKYETAKTAMDLVGVNVVYLYLNDYWFNINRILPLLKENADELLRLEGGKVWIGKFVRK